MKERWYRADFETEIEAEIEGVKYNPDSEYFVAKDDEAAIKYAKHLANQGWDYIDAGHVDGELVSVTLVDDENEFVDIKTIYE
jgi:predicted dinucleotide-binding enzyme